MGNKKSREVEFSAEAELTEVSRQVILTLTSIL